MISIWNNEGAYFEKKVSDSKSPKNDSNETKINIFFMGLTPKLRHKHWVVGRGKEEEWRKMFRIVLVDNWWFAIHNKHFFGIGHILDVKVEF